MKTRYNKPTIGLQALAALLFLSCLCLPAVKYGTSPDNLEYGIYYLLLGWLGLMQLVPAWLANPLFLLTLGLTHARPTWGIFTGFISSAFALSTFGLGNMTVPGGGRWTISEYAIGFYLWLGAITLALIASDVEASYVGEDQI